ncbi:MAG: HD domain-containing protein [Clostridia bacterium]|nr:HD domain-containing protein [Clostridia bacterium]
MQERLQKLYLKMMDFDRGQPDLIQHFTKVHAYAKLIAELEGIDPHVREVLEAAALVHDIGIPACDEKYGSHPGPLQEKEGPPLARALLSELGFAPEEIERVCTLVGQHHTLSPVDGIDHQILLEADLLVNCFSHGNSRESLEHTLENVIATKAGREIFTVMFGL